MLVGKGDKSAVLNENDIRTCFEEIVKSGRYNDKKILAVFPDHTRSGPVPLFFKAFADYVGKASSKLDFLIALGTHGAMSDSMIEEHFGITADERTNKYGDYKIINHEWDNPDANVDVGVLTKDDVESISGNLLSEEVRVSVNKLVLEYDRIIICGPVFPHEVVGFSGGNKYLFPGVAEGEIINFFHWLGALITNPKVIGNKETPIRKVVEKCADMIKVEKDAFCYVVNKGDIAGVFGGDVLEAWSSASDLSKQLHICYKKKPFKTVLSCAPKMYDDLWTGGKCMYKLENVVEDGGTLIIYAPHISEISETHGKVIESIGYHCRDYFTKQMDKFDGVPRGVIAHSTHVRGIGTFEDGVEKPRIKVILASQVSKERCEKINLGYMNPDDINVEDYSNKEDEGILYVAKAGEMLYKLDPPPAWQE